MSLMMIVRGVNTTSRGWSSGLLSVIHLLASEEKAIVCAWSYQKDILLWQMVGRNSVVSEEL